MIRRFVLGTVFCGLLTGSALAYWQSIQQISISTAPAGYSGPGDIVSGASMFFGLRGYNAAFSGAVVNICDIATGLVCADATWASGTLTLPTIGGVICNNSTNICVVKTLYDQTGNGFDVTQATNSARPTLTLNCIGTLPCMTFVSASSQGLASSATYTRASPWSGAFVGNRTTAPGAVVLAIGFQTGIGANRGIGWAASADTVTIVSSTFLSTAAVDGTFHAVQGVTGASGTIAADGSSTTGNAGTNGITAQTVKIGFIGSAFLDGQLTEAGVWPAAFSAQNISDLNSNAHSYWGF